jgi:hypothetical protein
LQRWSPRDGVDYFEAVHDGFLPLVHRRRVAALRESAAVIVDSVIGAGNARADVHWHVDPAWQVRCERGGLVRLEHEAGGRCWLVLAGGEVEYFRGDDETGLGWCSPVYGRIARCTTIRVRRSDALPLVFVAVVDWSAAPTVPVVTLLQGKTTTALRPGDDDSVGVRVVRDDVADTLLFAARPSMAAVAPADGNSRSELNCARASFEGESERFETDARFAHFERDASGAMVLESVLDGSLVREVDVDGCTF